MRSPGLMAPHGARRGKYGLQEIRKLRPRGAPFGAAASIAKRGREVSTPIIRSGRDRFSEEYLFFLYEAPLLRHQSPMGGRGELGLDEVGYRSYIVIAILGDAAVAGA